MKDGLDRAALQRLAEALRGAEPSFDSRAFLRRAMRGLKGMELKERVRHAVCALGAYLPGDFTDARAVVLAAGAAFPEGDPDDPLRGFAAWPLIDWVAERATPEHADDLDAALEALRALTPLFTAEFAVRPFLLLDTERTMAHVEAWATDANPAVRRLASEGIRPRLPWAARLPMFQRDPRPVLRVLERLKDDPAETVRRSVANNLNDIAKDHPDRIVKIARRWSKGASEERAWVIRHATRSLVKQGHPGVLSVLGFTGAPKLDVELTLEPRRLQLGGALQLKVQLRSTARRIQRLVVDFAVHHRKANGTLAPKVFKLRTLALSPGERVTIDKAHAIRPISTRRYYPGEHAVELLVNGEARARAVFELRL